MREKLHGSTGAAVIRKILIAVDESMAAACAAKMGVDLADQLHATVLLLHVVDPAFAIDPAYGVNHYALDQRLATARQMLHTIRAMLPSWVPMELLVDERVPADGIVKIASRWHADLIILGNDERGKLLHALVGSVADNVLRQASCPVMTVSVHACKSLPADLAAKCDA